VHRHVTGFLGQVCCELLIGLLIIHVPVQCSKEVELGAL
jgi:hypothetical protein